MLLVGRVCRPRSKCSIIKRLAGRFGRRGQTSLGSDVSTSGLYFSNVAADLSRVRDHAEAGCQMHDMQTDCSVGKPG